MKVQRHHFVKASNYWVARLSEWLAPVLRILLRCFGQNSQPQPRQSWRQGLLMGPNHIGDVLYLTASLPQLKEGLPNCQWDIVVSPPAHEVLEGNPCLREVIGLRHERRFIELWQIVWPALRGKKYDVILCYDHGRAWKDLLLGLALRIPNRVGFAYKGFSALFTHPISIPNPYPQSCAGYIRDLLEKVTGLTSRSQLIPNVYLTPKHEREADILLREICLPEGQPPYVCFATSRQASGGCPPELIFRTVQAVIRIEPRQVFWVGAKSDEKLLINFQAELQGNSSVVAGVLSLPALVSFMRHCHAVITTDSGPRHLANAARIPVFFFRNLMFHPTVAGVYCENEYDLVDLDAGADPAYSRQNWLSYDPEILALTILETLRRMPRNG